jgi:hypothetical protein
MSSPKVIKIDDKEYVLKDDIPAVVKERKGAWTVGETYLIRTVTMMDVGRLVYIDDNELILAEASWIADSGRFNDAIKTGKLNEVEPFDDEAIIGRGAIVDAVVWKNPLPKAQK